MTFLLAVLSLAQASSSALTPWAVMEFRDQKGGVHGRAASDAVIREMTAKGHPVVPEEALRKALDRLRLQAPVKEPAGLSRAAAEAMGGADASGTVVSGEMRDCRVRSVDGGRWAAVALRLVAYDVGSALPVNGAQVVGESEVRRTVSDAALIAEAIRNAAATAVRRFETEPAPVATVLNTLPRHALINRGVRDGYRTADAVFVTHGGRLIATGRVGVSEPDRAEIAYETVIANPSPGDRVSRLRALPPLPAPQRPEAD